MSLRTIASQLSLLAALDGITSSGVASNSAKLLSYKALELAMMGTLTQTNSIKRHDLIVDLAAQRLGQHITMGEVSALVRRAGDVGLANRLRNEARRRNGDAHTDPALDMGLKHFLEHNYARIILRLSQQTDRRHIMTIHRRPLQALDLVSWTPEMLMDDRRLRPLRSRPTASSSGNLFPQAVHPPTAAAPSGGEADKHAERVVAIEDSIAALQCSLLELANSERRINDARCQRCEDAFDNHKECTKWMLNDIC